MAETRSFGPFDTAAYMLEASDYVSRLQSTAMLLNLAIQRIDNKRPDHAREDIAAALRGIQCSLELNRRWATLRDESLAEDRRRIAEENKQRFRKGG